MLKPGTVIGGRYRLRHIIAEGGMAEVYLAELVKPCTKKKFFAIKRLQPELSKNKLNADLFVYEASLTSSLKHKNIVACHEFLEEGNNFYMVMEYVFGKEVYALIPAIKTLSIKERTNIAIFLGMGVCEALLYAHQKTDHLGAPLGLVHADVSPQNIMITASGETKLYDFGAAKTGVLSSAFDEEILRGNLRYMSPEQIAGEEIDLRSDVYSLSLVLLELICGEKLSLERSEESIKFGHVRDTMASIDTFDFGNDSVRDFFKRGLAIEREKRFESCHQMKSSLRKLVDSSKLEERERALSEFMSKASGLLGGGKSRRRISDASKSLFYVSTMAILVGILAWSIVAICTQLFEPKYMRKLPFWPTNHETDAVQTEPTINLVLPSDPKPKMKVSQAQKNGTLFLVVKPWANVFIDGKFLGATPMQGLTLPEGKYLIQLNNPELSASVLRMVRIYADKKTELVHNF